MGGKNSENEVKKIAVSSRRMKNEQRLEYSDEGVIVNTWESGFPRRIVPESGSWGDKMWVDAEEMQAVCVNEAFYKFGNQRKTIRTLECNIDSLVFGRDMLEALVTDLLISTLLHYIFPLKIT